MKLKSRGKSIPSAPSESTELKFLLQALVLRRRWLPIGIRWRGRGERYDHIRIHFVDVELTTIAAQRFCRANG